ncbi:MAG: hypothetical protein JWQ00_1343, partial [Noviherbaspirillum sp.]|nr:hypothetical protein [Noviherbaspirillum sp.]
MPRVSRCTVAVCLRKAMKELTLERSLREYAA